MKYSNRPLSRFADCSPRMFCASDAVEPLLSTKRQCAEPWNKGRAIGQKLALTRQQISQLKAKFALAKDWDSLALLTVAIDSMLRASDLLALTFDDVTQGDTIRDSFSVKQRKTGDPVTCVLTSSTQYILSTWAANKIRRPMDLLFPIADGVNDKTRRRYYQRTIKTWMVSVRGDPSRYSSHSLRRTKASIIYEETKNIEVVRILLGHKSLASTACYLGIDSAEALDISRGISL